MTQPNFYAVENQLQKIHGLSDFLPRLKEFVDFEGFRPELGVLRRETPAEKGGRPPFDVVLMFKVWVLKTVYNLSDEGTELFVRDRLSFQEFLGLELSDRFPDAKTIWLFGEQMKREGLERKLFDRLNERIEREGFKAKGGNMVDGSFVEVPRQRNTREENEQVKRGETPETFAGNPHRKAQKDVDARWAKKGSQTFYGYKDHVKADAGHKIIRDYEVSAASLHDSEEFVDFFPGKPAQELEARRLAEGRGETPPPEDDVYADSAYEHHGEELRGRGYNPKICEKGRRNHPLTEGRKAANREKSRTRCRVEHIFGAMKSRMRDEVMRCIGMARAKFQTGMRNLVYNMGRFAYLMENR